MKYALAVAALTATAAAADCKIGSFEIYKDKECKEIKAKATADELKTMNSAVAEAASCNKAGKFKQTCDAKGLKATAYKDDECKTVNDKPDDTTKKALAAATLEWGKCGSMGGMYVKLSGAKALMASTAAALAFVGSQF